jgi:hypothetical protein
MGGAILPGFGPSEASLRAAGRGEQAVQQGVVDYLMPPQMQNHDLDSQVGRAPGAGARGREGEGTSRCCGNGWHLASIYEMRLRERERERERERRSLSE